MSNIQENNKLNADGRRRPAESGYNKAAAGFAVSRKGVLWIMAGFAVMVLGYILLAGGGAKSPDEFSPAIFSFRRLVMAPLVIVAGVILVTVAIMRKPKGQ